MELIEIRHKKEKERNLNYTKIITKQNKTNANKSKAK